MITWGVSVLGEVIKRERLRRNWSQRDLSTHSGIAQATVSLIERNQRKNPSFDILQKFAQVFETTVDELMRAATESTRVFPREDLITEGMLPEEIDESAQWWDAASPEDRSSWLRATWDYLRTIKELEELMRPELGDEGARLYSQKQMLKYREKHRAEAERQSQQMLPGTEDLPTVFRATIQRLGKYLTPSAWERLSAYAEGLAAERADAAGTAYGHHVAEGTEPVEDTLGKQTA